MKAQNASRTCPSTPRPSAAKTSRFHYYSTLAGAALALLCPAPARATLAQYQAAVTNEPSLLSYYTFEQNNAADLKGAHPGTLAGTTAFTNGAGGFGRALALGGAGWVNLGVVPDFAFTNDNSGSIEAWVRAGTIGADACMFATREYGWTTRYSVHMASAKTQVGMWNGNYSGGYKTLAIANASTNWHHLVVVFDSDKFTAYWDGTSAGSFTNALGNVTDRPTQIGNASPLAAEQPWIGALDEVAIYADALTPAAVQAHYQAFFADNPPTITKQPQGGTYLPGVALTLNVTATGTNLSYQWYKGATALNGKTTSALAFPSLSTGDAGTYSVTVSNTGGKVPSAPAILALSSSLPAPLVRYQTAVSNETSLISYYTFDRLMPEDVFGSHEGTLAGTAGWGAGFGEGAAQGLLLNGSGHVSLGTVADFDFSSGVGTIEGWVRADWTSAPSYEPCLFANRNGPTLWSIHLSSSKNRISFFNGESGSWYYPPNAGTNWHHVAVVIDAGTVSCYWDGDLVIYSPLAQELGVGSGTTVQLGSSADTVTSEGWIGMLDEVAFYSTALSGDSIQAHYNAYYQGQPPAVTTQPIGGTFLVGKSYQTSAGTSGTQKRTYQWYKDDVLIPGATTAIIGTSALTPAYSGKYYLAVSNDFGSTNSATAIVQVGNNMARYQATVLGETSLISYYTFDDGDARDARNAHPGTVANSATYEAGYGGVTNLALILDGTGHVDLGYVPEFEFGGGSGTVEGWIRADWTQGAAGYNPCLFAARDGGSDWSVHMEQWSHQVGNFSSGFQMLSTPYSSGWHYYAIVFDAGFVSMYWDGQPLGAFAQTINFLSKPTQLGSSTPTATTEGWIGGLDEVAFYSTALGADTIWNHFLAMVGPPSLSCSLAGTQLTLAWPEEATGFTLEYAESLPAASWTTVTNVVNNQVTVDTSAGRRFFRLRK